MPSTTVSGELLKDGKKVHDVEIRVTFNERMVDEESSPVGRTLISHDLMTKVPDGRYTLRYFFNGKTEEHQVRIERGRMLAG